MNIPGFDLIIVIGYFRSSASLLSSIRYLSSEFKVGVIFSPLSDSLSLKVSSAQDFFYNLCISYGAIPISLDRYYSTNILLVQQFQYHDSFVSQVCNYVCFSRSIGVLQLASVGLDPLDNFLFQFNIKTAFAQDVGLLNFLLDKRDRVSRYESIEIIEVGLPFSDYPIYPDLNIDWFIACPTTFSFRTERDKHLFLQSVTSIVVSLPSSDVVVYKSHNGFHRDYFTPKAYYYIAAILSYLRFPRLIIVSLSNILPKFLSTHLDRLITSFLHSDLLELVSPLSDLTTFHQMPIEPFLPFVKKGIIGGLSNVMWAARYYDITYLNCIPPESRNLQTEFKSGSSNLLDLNLEYFGIPYYKSNSVSVSAAQVRHSNANPDLITCLRASLSSM